MAAQERDKDHITSLQGLAALSLDALSSVAYGPEAIVVVLVAAGASGLRLTVPVAVAIAVLLAVLVVSYRQVIAVHPDGGGAYAVAKKDLGRPVSLLAAASLVVDYVLTVAVSLAAGAASLGSAFHELSHHLLLMTLIGLVLLTVLNLVGIAESAKVLMLPTVVFIAAILAVIAAGLARSHPAATVGTAGTTQHLTEAVGVILVLKAFAAGCSALTGVEAIANGVPAFREPRVKRAQHTELMLGGLLGAMLIGLSLLIRHQHVAPRGGVTVLAQVTAGAFGNGWPYYATNIVVTIVLGLAANTSFGGLPVLMSLLAKDHRLPHLFGLRAEKPVYRYGVVALAILSAALLAAVGAETQRLIPLYAIGVFTGFTISQTGLVVHWWRERPARWQAKAALNGFGAILTAVATVVFLLTKFTEGAWIVVLIVPLMMLLFTRIERYYKEVAVELGLGTVPARPERRQSVVIVPVARVSRLAERALDAALAMGGDVVAVSVHPDAEACAAFRAEWEAWNPGVRLETLESPHRTLVQPIVHYVKRTERECGMQVAVLVPEIMPRHRWYRILHNQRDVMLVARLRARTDAVVCTFPYRLNV